MKWWERLRAIIDGRDDLSVPKVAKKAGVNPKSLYGYLKGEVEQPRGDVIDRLAKAVGTNEQALHYGDLPTNVIGLRRIPLLDMKKLGTLKPSQDALSVWDGVSNVSVPIDVPEGSYGVVLQDDSGGESFPQGSVAICNPAAEVLPGRYVIAVITDVQTAHFAKFRPLTHGNAKRFKLIMPNKDYPEIEVGTKVKGFVLARAIKHIRDI